VSFERFTDAQKAALDLTRNIAVSSGAGCGKTQVLAGRYLSAMLDGGARPDEILAITFTEKAAAEMRARIRAWLPEARRADGANLRVSTIHAFAAWLLREHALAADVDPGFGILEGAERIVLLRESIDELLDALAAEPPAQAHREAAAALRGITRGFTRVGLVITLRRLIERREVARKWAEGSSGASDAELIARWKRIAPGGAALVQRLLLENSIARALEMAQVSLRNAGKRAAEAIAGVARALAKVRAGQEEGVDELLGAIYRADGNPRTFGADPAAQALLAFQEALAPHRDALMARIRELDQIAAPQLRALAVLAQAALRTYDARKAERQALDFDDLGERAAALLARDPAVRARVRSAFRHLLVDEVQDVSAAQWDLVRWIATDDGKGERLRKTGLFVVGDEKQSIYRFRGADVSVFASIRQAVTASGGAIVTLADNFRSDAAPLEFTNALFERLLGDAKDPWDARPQALRASRSEPAPKEQPAPGVDLIVHVDDDRNPAADEDGDFLLLYGEADRVARYLVRERPEWRHAAVLLPQRTHLRSYQDALRRHDVPFVVLGGVGFYQAQEVVDLICLLRFLADERRDIELGAVLRSPLCALSDALLYAVARQKGATLWKKLSAPAGDLLRAADHDERATVTRAQHHLAAWRREAGRIPTSELLARALDESGAWAALAHGLRGPQRIANVGKLLDIVRDYERGGFRGLGDVAAALGVLMEEEEREGEAAVESAGIDAVRILTVHAAKGLEFPLVVVPELGARFRGDRDRVLLEEIDGQAEAAFKVRDDRDGGRMNKPGLYQLLAQLDRKKGDAEMKRLLYVACTRARERLVLSGAVRRSRSGDAAPPARSWLGWLCEAARIDLDAKANEARVGASRLRVLRDEDLPRAAAPAPQNGVAPLAPDVVHTALACARPLPERGVRVRLTPTLAKELERCAHKVRLRLLSGLPEFDGDAVDPEAPLELDEPAPGALARGTLLHRAMELDAFAAPDPDAIVRRLAAAARIEDAQLVRQVAAQVRAFGKTDLGRRVARAQPSYAELPFVLWRGEIELRGAIDRLVHDESGWLLIDWKTDEITAAAAAARAREAGYFAQTRLYMLAARQLLGEKAGPIRAIVYFTQPGVAVETPDGSVPSLDFAAAALMGGHLPAPEPSVCRNCGYHVRRICNADRAQIS
jgi:ATP-dependent helicase/nuclease subunit A